MPERKVQVKEKNPAEKLIDKLAEKEEKEWREKLDREENIFKDSDTMRHEIAKQLPPGEEIVIIPGDEEAEGIKKCGKVLLVLIGEYEGQDSGRLGSLLSLAYMVSQACRGITQYIVFYAASWIASLYYKFKNGFDKIKEIKEIWLKMPFTEPVLLKKEIK